MHICFISEGSYPYISGGVSEWVQSLMQDIPMHTFSIVSIYPESESKGKFLYEFPDNLVEVRENFLDTLSNQQNKKKKFVDLDIGLKQISNLFTDDPVDWDIMLKFLTKNKESNMQHLVKSKPFYNMIMDVYNKQYSKNCLSDFFWTIRSIILPLLYVSQIELPQADLYHSLTTGYAGVLAALGKTQHNHPMVVTEHGIYSRERVEEIIAADWVPIELKDVWMHFFNSVAEAAYEKADCAITLYEHARQLQHELNCDKNKQMVISNGIDLTKFSKVKKATKKTPKYSVGTLARIVPIKDIITMLQAFKIVYENIKDIKFYIMGSTEESKEYYKECLSIRRLLHLEDVVEFTGKVNVKEYLPLIDVVVLSSLSEGQPFALLESLSVGIPCVATNVGSCKELLQNLSEDESEHAGFIVPVMDYKKMAYSIIDLLKDEALRTRMGEVGKNRIIEKYNQEDTIKAYQELYEEFI